MTVQEIKELIGAFSEANVIEMDLELENGHLQLKKAEGENPVVQAIPAVTKTITEHIEKPEKTDQESDTSYTDIKAPLAGIFYRSSSPDAKPYVEPGQTVKKGDTIGLIEAMKVMNEIPAPHDGVVTEIFAENETFVAFDEVLMRLEQN